MLNFLGIIYLKCQNDQLFDLLHPLIWGGGRFWKFFFFFLNCLVLECPLEGSFVQMWLEFPIHITKMDIPNL